ncbi:MAG: glycosyltransferase family 2 protein [Thermodesulfovibrionales bacterium]|nr:glycosyltransferase family 2 protein [Thermodesulfovibrionales bacterium]
MRKSISIIIPVYNEEACLMKLWERLDSLQKRYDIYTFDFLFINDGSFDNSLKILKSLATDNKNVKVISFSRNFGHDVALTAGTDHVSSDAVVFMDADLRDPPELIDEMLSKYEEGYDVVYAVRTERKGESIFKIKSAEYFYSLLNSFSYIKIPSNTSNFRLISKKVLQTFKNMTERDRFIRGMITWIGFRQCPIFFDRDPRFAGETKYNLKKMIALAINGIVSFSYTPLRFGSYFSFLLLLVSAILFILFFFYNKPYLTISVVFFVGALQLFVIGVIGEYLIRVFNETRSRPLYVIDEKINID